MTPLPVIGEPFRRIAMDIVGQLPRKGRDNANADAFSRLDSTPHLVPEKEGGNIKDWLN